MENQTGDNRRTRAKEIATLRANGDSIKAAQKALDALAAAKKGKVPLGAAEQQIGAIQDRLMAAQANLNALKAEREVIPSGQLRDLEDAVKHQKFALKAAQENLDAHKVADALHPVTFDVTALEGEICSDEAVQRDLADALEAAYEIEAKIDAAIKELEARVHSGGDTGAILGKILDLMGLDKVGARKLLFELKVADEKLERLSCLAHLQADTNRATAGSIEKIVPFEKMEALVKNARAKLWGAITCMLHVLRESAPCGGKWRTTFKECEWNQAKFATDAQASLSTANELLVRATRYMLWVFRRSTNSDLEKPFKVGDEFLLCAEAEKYLREGPEKNLRPSDQMGLVMKAVNTYLARENTETEEILLHDTRGTLKALMRAEDQISETIRVAKNDLVQDIENETMRARSTRTRFVKEVERVSEATMSMDRLGFNPETIAYYEWTMICLGFYIKNVIEHAYSMKEKPFFHREIWEYASNASASFLKAIVGVRDQLHNMETTDVTCTQLDSMLKTTASDGDNIISVINSISQMAKWGNEESPWEFEAIVGMICQGERAAALFASAMKMVTNHIAAFTL